MDEHETGKVISSAAAVYEEFFVPALFGQWVAPSIAAAGQLSRCDVLDVGAGTGIVARAVSTAQGVGRVVGLDPNPAMLEVASRANRNVEWIEAGAESMPFADASFDVVFAQFSAMFFSDRKTGLAEIARVLRDDGRAVVLTWASLEWTPGYREIVALIEEVLGGEAARSLRVPFSIGSAAELHSLLEPYFGHVEVEKREGTARFDSIDDWLQIDIRGWTLAASVSDEQFDDLRRAASQRLARFTDAAGRVSFPVPAILAVARNPL